MKRLVGIALMVVLATASVAAQDPVRLPTERLTEAVPPAGAMPTLLQDIGLDQKLNEPLPLGLRSRTSRGATWRWATTSDVVRWCWCWRTTSARCCAPRCSTAW